VTTTKRLVSRTEFELLQQQIADLKAQLASLVPVSKTAPEPKISEDLITVIAAALAAYLGKRATIKFVRTIGDENLAWQNYGRASISGSHRLNTVRGW
jgi:methylmalonyl-CoA carboxyltransferase 12S subunit